MRNYYQSFISYDIVVNIEAFSHDDNVVFNLTVFDSNYNKCRIENINIDYLKFYLETLMTTINLARNSNHNVSTAKPVILSNANTKLGCVSLNKGEEGVVIVLDQFVKRICTDFYDITIRDIKDSISLLDRITNEFLANIIKK